MSKEELQNLLSEFGPRFSKSAVIIAVLVFILITTLVLFMEMKKTATGHLQFVACDVGQGDAFYLKTPGGLDILVDGGPDDKVLTCLSKNMPFWDRKLEMVFLTHNHADHKTGIDFVRNRYQIDKFFDNKTLAAGDKIKTSDGVIISILWPSPGFVFTDLNQNSLVLRISNFLLMGDADSSVQPQIMAVNPDLSDIDILKVPHHGSLLSLDSNFLKTVSPNEAVISVGNNSFGHPAPETIKQLEDLGIKIRRADKEEIKF